VAILIGDLAFVYADRLLAAANPTAWEIWNELRIELNVGQVLDILGSVRGVRDVAQAERICRYKSGKYTIERPLHLGAALAAPARFDRLGPVLSGYGLPLGDAFQMRDDVMGAFGDTRATGKPVGGDLREGKPTPLLARAIAVADSSQRGVLQRVGHADLTDEEVTDIQQVIVDTGALDDLERTIVDRTREAVTAIEAADLDDLARDELVALATYVSQRET
jgi:geranylgeranyl diphosphate synthase type I